MRRTFLATHEANLPQWQLSCPPSGTVVLVGWRTAPELEVDAGVPAEVAFVLARALTSVALVTFPSSECPVLEPPDLVQVFEANTLWQWMLDRTSRMPAKTYMISTRQATIARQLFDDGLFPWSMQANLALLGRPDAGAPKINRAQLFSIMEAGSVEFSNLDAQGIVSALLPGVDGSVAAIYSADREQESRILIALEQEARGCGFTWRDCSALEFGDALADERPIMPQRRANKRAPTD